jgi:hypothetical protein
MGALVQRFVCQFARPTLHQISDEQVWLKCSQRRGWLVTPILMLDWYAHVTDDEKSHGGERQAGSGH